MKINKYTLTYTDTEKKDGTELQPFWYDKVP